MNRLIPSILATTIAVLGTVGAPSSASAMDLEVGGRLGGGWNTLVQPNDPVGSTTLLHGSVFSGGTFLIGPSATLGLMEFEGARLNLSADLLYGFHRASGWEEYADGGRVDVSLTTHVARLPILIRVASSGESISPTLGLGIEPIFGIMSGAVVEQTGISQPAQGLETTPASSVAGLLALGLNWDQGTFVVPVDMRLAWNPFVGSSTEERFDNYQSRENTGAFRVMFDWQFMVTAGVRIGVGGE